MVIRADRADGIVIRNLLARGALEHGIYIEETDGYRIERTKMFWAADYGNLTFTSDHGLYKNCDAFGSGDASIYPGAAPETGEQADLSFYPDAPRINTVVKKCDLRGSVLGYSGSMGNSVRITQNEVYGNGAGLSTDTISAAGHPGFPADSVEIDHNNIYSNNLDLYEPRTRRSSRWSGSCPRASASSGPATTTAASTTTTSSTTGAGARSWSRSPTGSSTPEGNKNPGISCPNPELSTSCGNEYFNNNMGVAPPGFTPSSGREQVRQPDAAAAAAPCPTEPTSGGTSSRPTPATAGSTTPAPTAQPRASPEAAPATATTPCRRTAPRSVGTGDTVKFAYLSPASSPARATLPPEQCDWFDLPPQPGSPAAKRAQRRFERGAAAYLETDRAAELEAQIDELTSIPDSSPPE